jgi:hypothetical protein
MVFVAWQLSSRGTLEKLHGNSNQAVRRVAKEAR